MEGGSKPKILLLSDYSNFHATLARGLRKLGCDVTLVSDGGTFMNCDRDIDLSRRFSSKLGGLIHAADIFYTTVTKLRGFDVVSIRDPQFLNLKPAKILWFLNRIVENNKACFLSYISTDVKFLDMLEAPDSPLRYSEWFIEGKPNRMRIRESEKWDSWHHKDMVKLNDVFYRKMRGTVTALYEYHLSALRQFDKNKVAYGGIPIDTETITPQVFDKPKKARIFLARDYRRQLEKGSDLLEEAARNVVARFPQKAEFVLLENVPRSQYMEIMRSCHILLDQIYSYTPATMALEGMASGLSAISGAEKDYYDFIGETENFPIVNAPLELEAIEKSIENLVLHPEKFKERSIRSREFVCKHNSMEIVAKRFLNFWMNHA